ncbi:protein phosphatase 2C domain-containing protein [Micromonospora sp. WMMA1923]|uniref:protein phosphatase 2C domain-containing protein n=1 Tax=Micromonospora sp. WMMA1923 TaxID=3404125 RepID=UPI003B944D8A
MPATNPRPDVVTAERAGRDRPTEDRIFTTPDAVIVLDGASQPEKTSRDGGWLAEQVGQHLRQLLTEHPRADLTDTLAEAIGHVRDGHTLRPGSGPSTTVSIVRWTSDDIDVLVLGDSPAILLTRGGEIHQVRDDRLSRVASDQRAELYNAVRRRGGFGFQHVAEWTALVQAQQRARNTPGGYWIVEADPEAARHAVRASWPVSDIAAVLTMTDGMDSYRVPASWTAAFALADEHPTLLVEAVHQAEENDADGRRWPRSKQHDDKAVALIRFR